jgi:predicted Rossmann fold flavoprotein
LKLLQNFGVPILPPVPSLFALKLADPECADLAGITVEDVRLSLPGTKLEQRGTLLITHRGFSGPAAINLSAWAARLLKEAGYHHPLQMDWLPQAGALEDTLQVLMDEKNKHGARTILNHSPFSAIPARLWHSLCARAGITSTTRWADLTKTQHRQLGIALRQDAYTIIGRDAHRAEYVTCGGVDLTSIDLRRFESKHHPGLFFAGEVLDVDGLTGGYNLQNCWSTAWVAGTAMANSDVSSSGDKP